MMTVRAAEAVWEGGLEDGRGRMRAGSGQPVDSGFSARSRLRDRPGTNPEELLGAAHAGCYSMALATALERAGATSVRVRTLARVHLGRSEDALGISRVQLAAEVRAPGIDPARFQELARQAKATCPVSKALAGIPIELMATLLD